MSVQARMQGPQHLPQLPLGALEHGHQLAGGSRAWLRGCSEADFWDTMSPFYARLPKPPGFGVTTTVDQIGLGIVGATAVGFGAHGVAKVIQHRRAEEPEKTPPGDVGDEEGGDE